MQVMDRFTSPVFLSMNESGQLEDGLGGVPDFQEGRSILFVGNHQLLGIDMPILVSHLRSRNLAAELPIKCQSSHNVQRASSFPRSPPVSHVFGFGILWRIYCYQ